MANKVGVIGDKDSVLAFKAVGVEVFDCQEVSLAKTLVKQLTDDGFAVIFITEPFCEAMPDIIVKAKSKAYPVLLPIPTSQGSTGYGIKGIKKDIEKAIGTDILFK